ncbi:chloride channel protein [Alteromonas sp. 5E99-2]|uniref:chloride channel protein n=1 Tax=Alteromonas sp. 5E99-2 TaxID=2817683 RepID=UPI00325B7316
MQQLRCALAQPKTSVHLCALGIIGGVFAASIIILFRIGIEIIQIYIFEAPNAYPNAHWSVRMIAPFFAVTGILLVAFLTGFKHYRLGIPFVIHRIKAHFGVMPLRTTINQFFGGMLALASGFVVGREGPSVHLGAASSSFMGQALKLPYNSIRILTGCGIAAGISASFNTPLAAIVFVMEVVLREYRIHLFVPVMLAAACGSVMTRAVFGVSTELQLFSYTHINQWMFLYLILVGIGLGALATLFNRQLMFIMTLFRPVNMVWRLAIAAAVTSIAGVILPQALGANFESISHLFNDNPETQFIALILVFKMTLAIVAIGLGIPGGIIGPVMVIGMLAGVLFLVPLSYFIDTNEFRGSFALLGLAGMLAAVLHAPLAALTAVMELAYSPEVILPAILVIVPAYVTSTQFFKNRSVFLQQLDYQKLPYAVNPVRETLEKIGVLAALETDFKLFHDAPQGAIEKYHQSHPTCLIVQKYAFELDISFKFVMCKTQYNSGTVSVHNLDLEGVNAQATLAEVYDNLKRDRRGAVYIYGDDPNKIIGLVTWNQVQQYLQQTYI